jgi:hypothetical protein
MSIEHTRAEVIGSIWQAIAQSGVDLSAMPQDQQQKMVNQIADAVMVAIDKILDEDQSEALPIQAVEASDDTTEELLWEGRPFLSLVERYTITSERLKLITGLFSRNIENFELIRIQDIDFKQGINERILGIGDITIRGHDPSDPTIVLRNVKKPEEVYEIIRKAWLEARKRYGLQFREFM